MYKINETKTEFIIRWSYEVYKTGCIKVQSLTMSRA